jgi:hypothetical protein
MPPARDSRLSRPQQAHGPSFAADERRVQRLSTLICRIVAVEHDGDGRGVLFPPSPVIARALRLAPNSQNRSAQ